MRNLRVCSSPCPDGVVFGEERCRFSSPSPLPLPASSPEPGLIREESWERAEKTTEETVFKNWPTLFADQKRQEITQYLQGLVRYYTGCTIRHPYKSGQFSRRGGSLVLKGHVPLDIHTHINGLAAGSPEVTASADCRHMVSDPVLGSGRLASLGCDQSNLSVGESFYTKSYSCPSEMLKHCSPRPQKSFSAPLPESDKGTFTHGGPASCPMASPMQNCRPFLNSDQESAGISSEKRRSFSPTVNLGTI